MTNKTYDMLKMLSTVVIPAVGALCTTICEIWNIGDSSLIGATILACVTFFNTILNGYSKYYHSKGEQK